MVRVTKNSYGDVRWLIWTDLVASTGDALTFGWGMLAGDFRQFCHALVFVLGYNPARCSLSRACSITVPSLRTKSFLRLQKPLGSDVPPNSCIKV